MILRLLLLLSAILCTPFTCYAYLDKDAHLLNDQNGLADNTITAIHKDRSGWMWFATSEGLSRYDGREFDNYKLTDLHYQIEAMQEVSPDILMLVKDGMLHAFHFVTESFINVTSIDRKPVKASGLLPLNDSLFYIISGQELQQVKYFNTDRDTLFIHLSTARFKHNNKLVAMAYSPKKDKICLADTQGSLILIDRNTFKPIRIIHTGGYNQLTINSLYYGDDFIGIATTAYGLILYNLQTDEIHRLTYSHRPSSQRLTHTDVFQIVRIQKDKYLAVTWNGYTLIQVDDKTKQITTELFQSTPILMQQNFETRMISAYYDNNGILWIGTNGGGILWSDLRQQFYNQYYQDRHNEICSIVQDREGYIWLATFHQGIMRSYHPFNPHEEISFQSIGNQVVKEKETVLCSLKDKEDNLWFGNADGSLTFYNTHQKQWEIITLAEASGKNNSESVWSMLIDHEGIVWIGTSAGIWQYNPAEKQAKHLSLQDSINSIKEPIFCRCIAETPDHSVWLGTANYGLCKIVDEHTLVRGYEKDIDNLGNGSVRSLLTSRKGQLYIGYMTGFGVLDPSQNTLNRFYTTKDGLSNNFIGCIIEDAQGEIWLGSNSSITRYNQAQELFYNYYISGSNRSAYSNHQYLFWGNNRKLTYFNREDIDAFLPSNNVTITGFEINNQQVIVGKTYNGQIVLPHNIAYTSAIHLNYDNRNFALSFNNLSYSDLPQRYSYRLYPYQTDWINSNGNEKVSYVNLPAGQYVFEVKNLTPTDRVDKTTQLTISIASHWSQTVWFKACVALLGTGMMILFFYRLKIRQKRLKHELQLENEVFAATVERDKEMQIRMEREKFFTHAAHELRTPLTLILAPIQELLSDNQTSTIVRNKLTIIYRNAQLLHHLTDQLLYVQKIEAGMVKLNVSQTDIVPLVKEVVSSFDSVLASRQLILRENLPDTPVVVWIDIDKMIAAIRNIISNAIKYTDSNGEIHINLRQERIDDVHYCLLSVTDTGIGIEKDQQKYIFDSFITGKNTPFLSNKVGIGLRIVKNTMDLHHGSITLQSEVGKGSTFTLLIPLGKDHLDASICNIISAIPQEKVVEQVVQVSDKKRKSILIVEDNPEVRTYIRSLFCNDYLVYEANNGAEGIEMAISHQPDAIISDVMMPVKDGFSCCKELKGNPATTHIPILMLTAKAEDADMLRAAQIGSDDYMMKPFNPEILISRIKNLILQRERLKQFYTKILLLKEELVSDSQTDTQNEFIKEVIQIIEANLSNGEFSVKTLAEKLNMSQPTLYRKIKQYSELNAIDMIRSVRMSKAASLIMENRYSIQEVAEKVGYSDVRTLRKHFSEQFGVPPSKFTGF